MRISFLHVLYKCFLVAHQGPDYLAGFSIGSALNLPLPPAPTPWRIADSPGRNARFRLLDVDHPPPEAPRFQIFRESALHGLAGKGLDLPTSWTSKIAMEVIGHHGAVGALLALPSAAVAWRLPLGVWGPAWDISSRRCLRSAANRRDRFLGRVVWPTTLPFSGLDRVSLTTRNITLTPTKSKSSAVVIFLSFILVLPHPVGICELLTFRLPGGYVLRRPFLGQPAIWRSRSATKETVFLVTGVFPFSMPRSCRRNCSTWLNPASSRHFLAQSWSQPSIAKMREADFRVLDDSGHAAPNARQAIHFPHAVLGQRPRGQVGDSPQIRRA